jgi:pSer/pThr/pTyr-binding forkhead associated (FHA) protein
MMAVTLEIIEGPGAGRTVIVSGPVVVGRDPTVEVTLDDERISRRHVRLSPSGQAAVTVEDLGSSNGTFVNNNPVTGSATVRSGDELLIGVSVLTIRTGTATGGVPQPSQVRPIPAGLAVPEQRPSFVDPVGSGVSPTGVPELDPLVDARTKVQAKYAPIAVFALVVLVLLVFLATR